MLYIPFIALDERTWQGMSFNKLHFIHARAYTDSDLSETHIPTLLPLQLTVVPALTRQHQWVKTHIRTRLSYRVFPSGELFSNLSLAIFCHEQSSDITAALASTLAWRRHRGGRARELSTGHVSIFYPMKLVKITAPISGASGWKRPSSLADFGEDSWRSTCKQHGKIGSRDLDRFSWNKPQMLKQL